VVSTWNGGRVTANEWYGEGGRGPFLNYYRSILQRGTDHYLDICLSVIRNWALSNFIFGSPICYIVQYCLKLLLFLRENSGNMWKGLGIIMDSVVCGWANDKCRGTMGNISTEYRHWSKPFTVASRTCADTTWENWLAVIWVNHDSSNVKGVRWVNECRFMWREKWKAGVS